MKMRLFFVCIMLTVFTICTACSVNSPVTPTEPGVTTPIDAPDTPQNADAIKLDPSNPVTLVLWHYYTSESQQAIEQAIADFNQTKGLETGIIVEPVAMGSITDLEDAVTFSAKGVINSAPMPDIFSCYADKAMELDQLGVLADLNKYFSKEEQGEYVESFINDGIFDNRLLVLPIVKSTELLYVNNTALSGFLKSPDGASYNSEDLADWDSLYNICKAYYEWTDAKTPETLWDGKAFMGYDALANYVILCNKQLGIDIIDGKNGKVVLDKPALKKIFNIYYSGISLGYFDEVGKFRSDDVKAGDLAAYVGSSSSAAYFPTWAEENGKQMDIELLACQYPTFSGAKPYAIQQGAGMAVSNAENPKQEAAAIFLKWFTDIEQNVRFAMTTGYLPVKTGAYTSAEFDSALKAFSEGDTAKKNVGSVYEIALHQIRDAYTYAAKPFEGSYNVRSMLKNTLIDAGKIGKELAAPLKKQGFTAEEILAQLDLDSKFNEWIKVMEDELTDMSIKFTKNN